MRCRSFALSFLALFAVLAGGCGPDSNGGSPARSASGPEALAEARALLDTDRPWSAARVLRRAETDGDLSLDARLLAARAEAGAGDWARVLALLDGVPALDSLEGGRARYLLARAHDEAGDLDAARAGYDAFLIASDTSLAVEREAARLRRALVMAQQNPGEGDRALADVEAVPPDWRAVLAAEALARAGEVDRVEALAGRVTGGERGRRMEVARIEAARVSGDLAAARRLADAARSQAGTGAARAAFAVTAGQLADELGDADAARARYRDAIDEDPGSPAARQAAARLRQGTPSAADWLALARTDRALGLNAEAADAFRRWLAADVGSPAQQADIRYQAADALFDAQRYDEVESVLAPIAGRTDARELRAGTLGRMGRTDEAAGLYLALAAADPAPNLYFAADVLHQGGDLDRARALYTQIVRQHAGTRWAALATLRLAGQAFLDGDYAQAAQLWDGYRGDAREALRARYWAGRAHAEAGDSTAAADRFRSVLRQARDSYYALLASDALGEPFWPLPMVASPPADPDAAARVARALRGVDVLREAGFPEIAETEVDRVVAQVGGGQAVRYALAEALIERGYGRRAILIGQSLGGGTNARRLRILYPFPFRRMIAAEAQVNDVDPFVAAALIRQESQFSARATSHVGARGLMQLMPATGRTLAAEVGLEDWDPALLYLPEVNVLLGTRYVGQQVAAYDGSLPAVFGAYNAGPHQVDAWRAFPEFGRDALFAERIPFRETREYVKILTRNRAIYAGLYGAE
ncbi:transglycosylase SLT domain-containing protein [Rubrivirga sp. IMCC45206]|uniref:transglycosylase SLT domain-containing protein n=1 Tax=Rubrivirga sp. IMCC45206 TaxID=3391614 RepID=UPI0039902D85